MNKNIQDSPLFIMEREFQLISQDVLLIFDMEGIITDVNNSAVRIFGKNREKLIGTRFVEHFIDPVKANNAVKQVFDKGEVRDYELVMEKVDGPNPIITFSISPYKDQTGKIVGAFATGHDVTQQKRDEMELHYLQRYNRGLIEVSLDPLVTFDQEGFILDVNTATIRATGRDREELIGTPFADYFTDTDKAFKGAMMVFETGEVRDYELVMKAKDGTQTIVSYNASIYKDQTGKVVGAFAAARDITERKGAAQEIQNLQRYNRGLIETSLDPLVTFDQEGTILDVNGATIRATGRGRDELIGTPFADYFTDPDNAYKGAMLTFEVGEVRDYELVMKAKDGTETSVAYNASVYKDQTGKVVGAFAAARDITERKNAEIALSESKAELDLIFKIAADGMCVIDADYNIVKVNKTFIRMVDMDEDEIIGKKCYDIFMGELCHSEDCPLEKLKKGERFVEHESVKKRPDGKEIPVIVNAARLEQNGKFIGIVEDFKDITERKQAEEEIRDLQHYNRGLIEVSLDPLVTFDHEGIIMDVNEATIRATGKGKDELIGTPFADYFTDPDKAYKGAMLTFEAGEVRDYELVMKARDGTETMVAYNASVYKDQTGKVVGAFAAARDITERKGAAQEIQNLQRYNRGLIETSLDPLVTFDQEGIILDVNEATIRATGRSREELIGTPFADYFTDPDNAYKGAMLTFETGEVRDYELVMKAKDGTETIVSYNASVYKDQTGKVVGAFAAARDITERKNAEIALSESKAEVDLIFRIAANGMCVIDADFNVVKVNKTFVRMVDMDEDEIIGKKCYDIFLGKLCHTKDCPLEKLRKGERFVEHESVKKRPDGKKIPVIVNAARLEKNDKFVGIVEDFKDITERKQAEEEIRDLQRYNRGLIEVSLDPLVTFDHEGIIMDVNEATIRATGRGRDELIGTPFADYFTDSDNAYKGAMLTFEAGEVRDYELIMKARDGTETMVAYNASVYKDQTGKVVGAFAAARDITERKKAEIALSESKAEVDLIFQIAANGMCVIDADYNIVKVNKTFIDMVDMDEDEIIGKKCYDVFSGKLCHTEDCPLVKLKKGEQFAEHESVKWRSDGKEIPVLANAARLEKNGKFVGIVEDFKDITERKQAEIALSESKEEIDLIFQIAANGMCVIDADYNIVKVNKSFIRMVDMDEDEIVGKKCYDIFSGGLCHTEDCPLKKLKKGEQFAEHESVKKRPDGKEIPVLVNAARLEKKGEFIGIVEDFKDITERKQAEEEIHELQRYNRGLIEVSLDPLVTFDQEGLIMDVNTATIRATGRSRDELIGTPFADYFTDPEKAYKGEMKVFETGEIRDYELVMKPKNGKQTTVAVNASVYVDQTGIVVGAFAASRDITLQKKAEHELQETVNRLEAYTTRINSLMVTMLDQITEEKTKGVILDISGLEPDVEVAEPLINIAKFARQLGATCIVTGIKQNAVQKLTDTGANLAPITTERSSLDGLRYTIAMIDEEEES